MRKKILLGLLLVVSVLVVLNRVMVKDKKTVATSTGITQSTEYVTATFTPTVTVGK